MDFQQHGARKENELLDLATRFAEVDRLHVKKRHRTYPVYSEHAREWLIGMRRARHIHDIWICHLSRLTPTRRLPCDSGYVCEKK